MLRQSGLNRMLLKTNEWACVGANVSIFKTLKRLQSNVLQPEMLFKHTTLYKMMLLLLTI